MPIDIEAVDGIIAGKGTGPEAAIPILQGIQDTFRYLPIEALERVCATTQITSTELFGVATFYAQFRLTPVGEHILKVCHGTACHVGGAPNITEALCDELHVPPGGTTTDMKFTVDRVACVGCCSLAPVVMIDDSTFGRLDRKKAVQLLDQYK